MAEAVVLDPVGVAAGRAELDITPFVREEGPDWGDAAIESYLADLARGSAPVDFRVPNRTVTIPIQLLARAGLTFEQARERIQAKAALFQREGGWISRETAVGTLYADVVGATLQLGGGSLQAHGHIDADGVLTVETLPDWYGDEIALATRSETSAAELVFTETGVEGDYPARCRLIVTELDADDQLGLLWGFRSRRYDAAATARLAYEAEALDPLDIAAVATQTGASGGASNNVVAHTNLGGSWTPVLGTNIGGATYLTHAGSYRALARLRSPDGTAVKARFVWDVGDLALPVENSPWTFPGANNFFIADLGEVRLDKVPVGAHRWQGQIQAKGTVGGEDIQVDRVWFVPLDEAAGRLRVTAPVVDGMGDYTARDEFNQAAGALAGKALPVGGTWAGAGNATDFTVVSSTRLAQRTATGDTGTVGAGGRFALAGATALTNTLVQADFRASVLDGSQALGALARYVDTSNFLEVLFTSSYLSVVSWVAGVGTTLVSYTWGTGRLAKPTVDGWYTIRVAVHENGQVTVWFYPQGAQPGDPVLRASATALATGGALASGRTGLYDTGNLASAGTRSYDNFLAYPPTFDAVLHASQSAELRTDGMFREDRAGAAYGPVSHVVGDLPRLPPSGPEGRTVEVFVKASRGDLDQLPDTGIDDISAQVAYRPCWLFAPQA